MKILLVWPDKDEIAAFRDGLAAEAVEVIRQPSGGEALEYAAKNMDIALAAVSAELPDMTGLEFTKRLLAVNAMTGCAVASHLAAGDFHEESEGYGILMQLPLKPDQQTAKKLMAHLTRIGMISKGVEVSAP